MKSLRILLCIVFACLAATVWAQGRAGTLITIDPPGVGTAPGEGSQTCAIKQAGAVAGTFTDSSFVAHGFVRTAKGDITVFDAPGAGNKTVPGFVATHLA